MPRFSKSRNGGQLVYIAREKVHGSWRVVARAPSKEELLNKLESTKEVEVPFYEEFEDELDSE